MINKQKITLYSEDLVNTTDILLLLGVGNDYQTDFNAFTV